MGKVIHENCTNDVWLLLLKYLLREGISVNPRGLACYESLGVQTIIPMDYPIVTIAPRKLGYRFLFAEAWWILTGRNDVASIKPYSARISQFSDDGETFFGAYGPKIQEQLSYVIDKLVSDPHSRQAVINIWREYPPQSKDYPCTLSIQFMIRNDKLYCIDTMRSSDAWLGWPYDIFNFSMLSAFIALELKKYTGIKYNLGNLIMNIGSSHLYIDNFVDANECVANPWPVMYKHAEPFLYEPLSPTKRWDSAQKLVEHLLCIAEQRVDDLEDNWCSELAAGIYNK
jgi:thymidylate synthase